MRQLIALGIVVSLAALAGCSGGDLAGPESPSVPRVLESYVTGEAARLLDASGRLILPAPIPGQFPEIPASRASELAQAFVTTFGPYAKGDWEEWRGRTIRVERLTVCGRVTYARSSYEPALPDLTLWARKLLGSWWLVTLCDGKSAEVLIAVSVHDTDVSIDGRGWVVQPPPGGLNFLAMGIPLGVALPISPEAAVMMAATEGGARVSSIPEFVSLPRPAAPWIGAWQLTMDRPLRLAGIASGTSVSSTRLSVGYDEGWPVRLLGEKALVPARDGDELFDAGYPSPTPPVPFLAKFRQGLPLAYERVRVEK